MANTKIPSELIADSAITAAKLADGTITTADIADSNVTTAKIADSNVTTAKIGDAQVTTAKIVDANVTTAKIADSNVTTAKILDNNITSAKLASALTLGGNTTFSGNISLGDAAKAIFGAGEDLRIYHDQSNSINYIHSYTSNELRLESNGNTTIRTNNGDNMAVFTKNGAVTLYHDNNPKIATTSLGIDVTGDATILDTTPSLILMESDTTDVNTRLLNNGGDFFLATINDAKSSVTNRLSLDHATGDIAFYEDTGSTAKFFWDASAESLGIGTDSPTKLLHVNGQAQFENNIILNENTPALVIPNGDFRLFTGGSETLRVTSGRNLQFIAKTTNFENPGFTYHTNNYLYLRGGSSGLILSDDSGINTIQIIDGSAGYINFETGDGSSKMRIKSNGNVGIGETGPEYRLQVDGTNVLSGGGLANLCLVDRTAYNGTLPGAGITFRGEYTSGGNTTNFATIQGIKENTSSGNYATALRFTTRANGGNLTERMRIDSSGNVGIGTDSPSAAVPLTAYYSDTSQFHFGGAQAGISNNVYYNGSAYTNRTTSTGGTLLQLGTDGSFAMRRATSGSSPTLTYSMYIDANGNVGIGESSPAKLGLTGSTAGKVLHMGGDDCQLRLANSILHHDNSGNTILHLRNNYGATSDLARTKIESGYISFCTGTAFDEKMRLKGSTLYVSTDIGAHSGGSVNGNSYAHNTYAHAAVFGANSVPDGTVVIEDYDVSSGIGNTVLKLYLRDQDPATSATFIDFADGGGRVGSITHNDDGGGVSFNATSDYRLKENINYNWDATTLLKQLKPAKFNFKRAPGKTVQGFLAHEVSDLVPSSVRGDKDQMMEIGTIKDKEGNEIYEGVYEHFCKDGQTWTKTGTKAEYQQLDYSKLVPLLTKALQEQQTIIDDLKSRIETLEK